MAELAQAKRQASRGGAAGFRKRIRLRHWPRGGLPSDVREPCTRWTPSCPMCASWGEPCGDESGPTTSMASLRERLEHRWSVRQMSAYVDGDLSAEGRRRLERHADLCPECGPMRRTLMRLTRELGHLRAASGDSVAPGVIERWIESDREARPPAEATAVAGERSPAAAARRVRFDAVNAADLPPSGGPANGPGSLADDGPGSPSDDELVGLAIAGRRDAFEELVRRHADHLYAVILRFTSEPGEAEEVVQEAFLRAWRGIDRFERRSQFFTWLYRIGLNETKRRAGRRPMAEPLSVEEGALEQTADFTHAPERRAEQHDLRGVLERAVRALPEAYRAPLILRDVEGLSTEQAAEIMGLKEAAFKSRLHRARLTVRDAVDAYLTGDDS